MAILRNPRLTIQIDSSDRAQVRANVDVDLTAFEQALIDNLGLRVALRCQLWGEDSGFTGSDDLQFVFPLQSVGKDGTHTFSDRVSRDVLDEDLGGDEITARFHLFSREPAFPLNARTTSPEVHGQF